MDLFKVKMKNVFFKKKLVSGSCKLNINGAGWKLLVEDRVPKTAFRCLSPLKIKNVAVMLHFQDLVVKITFFKQMCSFHGGNISNCCINYF